MKDYVPHKKDYVPRKDAELVPWSVNFAKVVTENASEWGVTPEEVVRLQTLTLRFAELHTQSRSSTKNPVIVAKKNAAREALISEIRLLTRSRLNNPVVDDAQRIALGLHVHDSSYTILPAPSTRPELDINVVNFRRLKIMFHDMGSNDKARPYGVIGAMVAYAVLDAPPDNHNALFRTELATRTPHVLEFTEAERGLKVYVALCWVNKKGEKGPWSEIENAIVP